VVVALNREDFTKMAADWSVATLRIVYNAMAAVQTHETFTVWAFGTVPFRFVTLITYR